MPPAAEPAPIFSLSPQTKIKIKVKMGDPKRNITSEYKEDKEQPPQKEEESIALPPKKRQKERPKKIGDKGKELEKLK